MNTHAAKSPHRALALAAALLCASLASQDATAAVPVTLTVQGALSSGAGGVAADGNYSLTFALYTTKLGGKAAWQEGPLTLTVAGGQFQHALGAATPLSAKLLAGLKEAWLGVTVAKDPELPRQPLRSVAYALVAKEAAGLACSGCITAAHLAANALDGAKLGKGAVSAEHVGFPYAGAKTKGGPANSALDLQCTGCVSVSELKIDGDLDLGGNAIKASKGAFGTISATTISATSFIGDGSKLSGIKTPAGTCSKAGQVVKGIKADGSLDCVASMDPNGLPADGLDEISNGLLSNQFVDEIASKKTPVGIADNNPVGVSDELDFPDIGIAQKLTINLDLSNSDISKLKIKLFDPNNTTYVLYEGNGKGNSLKATWPAPTKPVSGDLTKWVGKNPKGKWRLNVIDSGFTNNGLDGAIKSWSVQIQTLSNKKVASTGILRMPGGSVLQTATKAPLTCTPDLVGYLYYNTKERTLRVCNGKEFDLVETLPGGLGSKGEPGLSCKDILKIDKGAKDGLYWLDPDGPGGPGGKYQAWCDMTTAGGGWVLVMQIQGGHSTTFGYGSSHWTATSTTASNPPLSLSSTNAKYGAFNTFKTVDGHLLLRDKTSKNHTVLEVPGMKGQTLLNRFQNLGGKAAYNQSPGTTMKLVSGKGSPQELMGFAAPSTMCSQNKNKWRMNLLSSHSGTRLGNDVATNKQTTNNPSSWKCYDNQSNLSYSGLGGTLESNRAWQDSYGSEALNRWRDNGGKGQGSQNGLELYVR